MRKKKETADDAVPTATVGEDQAGLTVTFPTAVREELLGLGKALGLGVRATQELLAAYYADLEEGPGRAAALQAHLRLGLTRFHHARELAELKARQAAIERAQAELNAGPGDGGIDR
jgi:hypothetical protein